MQGNMAHGEDSVLTRYRGAAGKRADPAEGRRALVREEDEGGGHCRRFPPVARGPKARKARESTSWRVQADEGLSEDNAANGRPMRF